MRAGTELLLIRHAPALEPGRLIGRTDPPARIDGPAVTVLARALPRPARLVSSPARRCVATAAGRTGARSTPARPPT